MKRLYFNMLLILILSMNSFYVSAWSIVIHNGTNPCCPGANFYFAYETNTGTQSNSTNWYEGSVSNLVASQLTRFYPHPTVTTTYYAEAGGSTPMLSYTIVVNPLPSTPSTPLGSNQVCINTDISSVTIVNTANATSYIWQITPSTAGTISGTSISATINWNKSFTGDAQITVSGQNTCGTGPVSNPFTISKRADNITFLPSVWDINNNCTQLLGDPLASSYLWSTNDTINSIFSYHSSEYTLMTTYSGGLQCSSTVSTYISDFSNTSVAPNGKVYSMYENSGKLYFGGDFDYAGMVSGNTALTNSTTGVFDSNMPRINGTINCIIPDGLGGWYIGGLFTKAGVYNYKNLVHIKADKTLDVNFKPEPNDEVKSLVLVGNKIYAAGSFTMIGEVSRGYLAQIDIYSGNASSWDPMVNAAVSSIALYDNDIIAGGNFTNAGSMARNYLAAIDTVYGQSSTWNPNPDQAINKIVLSGIKLYVAGNFTSIAGSSRNKLACILLSTEALTSWNPNPNNVVFDILPTASAVYVAGDFTSIGGQTRNYLAAVNTTAGTAITWNPAPNNTVYSLLLDGIDIVAGGKFTLIGADTRNCIAKISSSTGISTTWNPDIHGIKGTTPYVKALAIIGTNIYAGGSFYSLGGQARNNAACIDIATGQLTAWNPNVNNVVHAIYADNTYVYIGGEFTLVNGSIIKNRIAQLNTSNAVATGWNPNSDGIVHTLFAKGQYLYAGGEFTNIGNNARSKLAAIKLSDGTSSTWNPAPNNTVLTLSIMGDSIYVGGDFTSIGGQTRNRIAAYGITSQALLNFNPSADNSVNAITTKNNKVYVGGSFANIGGVSRNNFAIFNATTGNINSANPFYFNNTSINAVATSDSVVYMGGTYSFYNNNSLYTNKNASAIDNNSQQFSTYWHPEPNNTVRSICVLNDKIFLAGDFTEVLNVYQPFLVSVDNYCVANAHIADPFTHQFCEGDGVYLHADTNSNYTYQWYVDNTAISGADSSSFAPVQTGIYTVEVTDNLNYGSIFSNGIHVDVDQLADSAITASGPVSFCGGSVTLTAANGTGYAYQWYKNSIAITGATTNNYTANASGNYYVEIYNASGCMRNSQHIIVNTSNLVSVVSVAGNSSFCTGGNVVLSSDHTTGNLWYKNNTSTGITTQTYTATTSGVYKCFVTAGNCSGYSQAITVTVNSLPAIPTITQNVNTLTSSSTTGNQWYLNGNLISGAVSHTYNPTIAGSYQVFVTNVSGCTSESEIFSFTPVVLNHAISGTVKYNNSANTPLTSVVLNLMNGTTQISTATTDATGNFSLTNIADGSYTIEAVTTKPWGGVTSTDVLKLRRHIAGLEFLTEPIRLSAADANNSINLNSTDVLKMQRRIAGLDNSFPRGNWVFEKPVSGGKTIIVSGADISQNIYGLCVGDVNGSNLPSLAKQIFSNVSLQNEGIVNVKENQEFEIPVTVSSQMEIGYFQLFLNFNSEIFDVTNVSLSNHSEDFVFNVQDGTIKIVWSGLSPIRLNKNETLLTLNLKTKSVISNATGILLSEENEFSDAIGTQYDNVELLMPTIVYSDASNVDLNNSINDGFNIYPNPVKSFLTIETNFSTKQKFEILNILGEVVTTSTINKTATFNTSQLSSGEYFVKVYTDKLPLIKRFIKD